MAKKNKSKNKAGNKKSPNTNTQANNPKTNKSSTPLANLNFSVNKILKTLKCDFYLVKGILSTKSNYSYTHPIISAIAECQEQQGISLEDLSQKLYGDQISRIHKLKQVIADLTETLVVTTHPQSQNLILTSHGLDLYSKNSNFSPVLGDYFLVVTCNYPLLSSKILACKPITAIDKFGEYFGKIKLRKIKFDTNVYWHPGYNARFLVDNDGNKLLDIINNQPNLNSINTNSINHNSNNNEQLDHTTSTHDQSDLEQLLAQQDLTLKFAQIENPELVFTDLDSGKSCALTIEELIQFTPDGEQLANTLSTHFTPLNTIQNFNQITIDCTLLSPELLKNNIEQNSYVNISGEFSHKYLFGGDNDKLVFKLNGHLELVKGFCPQVLKTALTQQLLTKIKSIYGGSFDEKRGYLAIDRSEYDQLSEFERINAKALLKPFTCKNVKFMANSLLELNELDVRITLPIRPQDNDLALLWLFDLVYYETQNYHIVSELVFNRYFQDPNIPILNLLKDQLRLKRYYRKDMIKDLRQVFIRNDNYKKQGTDKLRTRSLSLLNKLDHGQIWDL